jgi:putative MFS transporter
VEEALDRAGFGAFQWRLFVICGLGWSADVGEIRLIGFLLKEGTLEWETSAAERSALSAVLFVGMLLGALLWGWVADYLGRKQSFTATCFLTFVFGVGSAAATGTVSLAMCRFGVGLGLGGNLAVDFSMFLEYLPAAYRGRATVWLTGWSAFGNVWATGLAWAVVPDHGWRPYVALCAAPILPVMVARLFVKESPRYLLATGKRREAAEVIVSIAKGNGTLAILSGANDDWQGRGEPPFTLVGGRADGEGSDACMASALFRPPLRRTMLPLAAVWFAVSAGFYGQSVNLPSFLVARGLSDDDTYLGVLLSVCAEIPGVLVSAFAVDRIGRRLTMRLALGGCALWLGALSQPWLLDGATALTLGSMGFEFCSSAVWGAMYLYTPEVLPTAVRASGLGLCAAIARVAGMLSPGLGQWLLTGGSETMQHGSGAAGSERGGGHGGEL